MSTPRYSLYQNAGMVPFEGWKTELGIELPIFDKDGTLTHANQLDFVDEVVDGLAAQHFPDIYPQVALVSNNHDPEHVREFRSRMQDRLGVDVFAICRADGEGHKSKPAPEMGLIVAREFGLSPRQLGIVGDRYFTDVKFGRNIGVGAIALCSKAGEGDARFVPALRVVEKLIVATHHRLGLATI